MYSIFDTLRWLAPFWRPFRWRLAFLLLLTPVAVLFDVWSPIFIKHIFDALQAGTLSAGLLARQVGIILALGVGFFSLNVAIQSLRGLTNFDFENAFRIRLAGVILQMGRGFFYRFRTGDVTTRLIDDISEKKLGWFACSGVFRFYQALITVVGSLFFMLRLNLTLTLVTLVPLIFVVAYYIISSQRTVSYSRSTQESISEVNAYLTATLDGIRVLKAYGQEAQATQSFNQVVNTRIEKELALTRVSAFLEIAYSRFSELGMLSVFLVGGWMVIQGQLSLGTLVAFNTYIFMLIWPMVDVGQFFIKGRQASVSVERVRELEDYPPEILQAPDPLVFPTGPLALRFESVHYGFADTQGIKSALENVSFEVRSGHMAALAGSIGSGKSLLLDMVPRMIEPQQGAIYLNDQPLASYDIQELRQHIGFVSQTPSLFSATLRENILFGLDFGPETEARLQEALTTAQFSEELLRFEEGLDTVVGQRGVRLSGGQKQRIAIARALIGRPSILILDDCTSALDAETEARFWTALHQFNPHMLVLLVTHRLRTLQQAQQVILLEAGRVLMRANGSEVEEHARFRSLYMSSI
jgi:ATP-binding cassette, subfamily B, multidrug efflux pump